MSVRKHRKEGGAKKPLSPEHKASHPGPFSFDDTRELEDARAPRANATPDHTDEEKGKHGKKSTRQKLLERKQKKARKEDEKAIRHMRRGGTSEWEKSVGKKEGRKHSAVTRGGLVVGDKAKKEKKDRGPRLSLHGLEREQMRLSLGEERRDRSEMEPAQAAPYPRGGEML